MINFENYKSLLFIDKYEKEFCKTRKLRLNPKGDLILIQCVNDIFYLKLFSMVIDQEASNTKKIYGVISIAENIRLIEIILVIPFLVKSLIKYFNKRKIKKMYGSIGVSNFIDYSQLNFQARLINFFISLNILFNLIK